MYLYDSDFFDAITIYGVSMHKISEYVSEILLLLMLITPMMMTFLNLYQNMDRMG